MFDIDIDIDIDIDNVMSRNKAQVILSNHSLSWADFVKYGNIWQYGPGFLS